MQIKDNIHGFTVLRRVPLEELEAVLYEMEHERTGAKLVWIDRKEENKTFGVAFETLPWNDTGVFHILEHSVLCGSKRYPVKEPFVELVKNSMNTFLNAMTFPDKTFYPISSPNDKDFVNLMRVYLDAVFDPAIYQKPEIFRQEGWHYAFDEDGSVSYTGVVFNEMKGAMASADEVMNDVMNQAMLPDTPYRFNSGGDPAKIPDLSYEEFIDAHRRFYSPANSYFYLDGEMDIDAILGIIDGEYLRNFGRTERIAPPNFQNPVDGGTRTAVYEIGPEEDSRSKTRIAWGRMIGRFDDRERLIAVNVLHNVIAENNESPLPKCVLKQGLAEDVIVSVMDSIAQPYAKLEVRNFDGDNTDRIRETLFAEIRRLAEEGLDHREIEASLANYEFLLRERDYGSYPQGLVYGFGVLDSWIYGGAPEANLEVGDLFDRLREKMNQGYFEDLLRELYLDNPHRCEVILTPSKTAGEARRAAEAARIDAEQRAWSGEEREQWIERERRLTEWQHSEDTPQQLATLPHLTLADVQDMPEDIPLEVRDYDGVTVLAHNIPANGILYVNAYFDVTDFPEEELPYLSFLTDTLGRIDTAETGASELMRLSRLYCGSLGFDIATSSRQNDPDHYVTKLSASFSTLPQNLDRALALVAEILRDTTFGRPSQIRDILTQTRMSMMQQITMGGHTFGVRRISAMLSAAGVVNERTDGFAFYQWLREKEEHWEEETFPTRLRSALAEAVNPEKLVISVTGDADEAAAQVVAGFRNGLAAEEPESRSREEKSPAGRDNTPANRPAPIRAWGLRREGIVIPADIAFANRGGDLKAYGKKWSGEVTLLARMVTYAYLWNVIRVQGGAYGTGLTASPSGLIACYSYRDPSGAESLKSYTTVGDFLRAFLGSDPDLTGFIIGAVSDASRLMTPRLKGNASDFMYFSGRTYEGRCEERRRMLNATPEKLLQLVDALESAIAEGGVSIIGGKNQIDACEGLDAVYSV